MPEKPQPKLLSDDGMFDFINRGYLLIETDHPPAFHQKVCDKIAKLQQNPGNSIYEIIPQLRDVYEDPKIRGALISLLGDDCVMNTHRHLHTRNPGDTSQGWHQDGTNVRHHQIWCVLAMYYPHDVSLEMGPTVVMPGTHFRNAPTDRMQSYTNIKGMVPVAVKAGTVAITHYDLWHAGTINRTDKPRHMLKFLFDRKTAPTRPSWDHDAETADQTARGRYSEMVGPLGYCSDYYKEWELRKEMWLWLGGSDETVPAGAFKDMLS